MNKRTRSFLYSLILGACAFGAAAGEAARGAVTAREVVSRIAASLDHWNANDKVDIFKTGDPDQPVTGIVVTMFPSMTVLKQAVARKANFLIVHEPTFYDHLENTRRLKGNPVLEAKQAFIEKHGLVIWRFHNHMHRPQSDMIDAGVLDALGWADKVDSKAKNIVTLPERSLRELASELMQRLKASTLRVVGPPDMTLTRVGLCLGGRGFDTQQKMLRRDDVDVILVGEAVEWQLAELVRDANEFEMKKAVIWIGHNASEEAGMKHCAQWIKELVPEADITFVPSNEPFWAP
ncbi:MAG: Nif3-like dinuclear metal center hexameric protein [Kiritimatiellia bacterium]